MDIQEPSLLVIAPHCVRQRTERPRRYLDPMPLPEGIHAKVAIGDWFDTDDALETQFYARNSAWRRVLSTARLLLQHHAELRSADVIYCLDGVYFEALLLLARWRLFRTAGKQIVRFSFHDRSLLAMQTRLSVAPAAFVVEVITEDQIARLSGNPMGGRLRYRPWAIDLDWFKPSSALSPDASALFLPGNAHRDESLIAQLLPHLADQKVLRVGRSERLIKAYEDIAQDPRFTLVINAPHAHYRDLLLNSFATLLPILPCDEPAGLTAAMEAMACEIPILANRSMGIAELFKDCCYPLPLVQDLKPSSWVTALEELRAQNTNVELTMALSRSRELLAAKHSIRPSGEDWAQVLHHYTSSPQVAL